MTTPGGVPNLPVGALTLDTLASKTQDTTPTAMKSRAAGRFSSIFSSSTGLDPASSLTPFGILTTIFGGFNSTVANADPADVDGPEDLPGLLIDFIESLPFVGQFVELLEAFLGGYTGDDETLKAIQSFFAPFVGLLSFFTGGALSTGALTSAPTNLMPAPTFPAGSIGSNPYWSVDTTFTRSDDGTGSAKVIADGTLKALRSGANSSAVIPVKAGGTFTASVYVAHQGYVGSGVAVLLQVVPYTGTVAGEAVTVASYAPSTPNVSWPGVELSGAYPPPLTDTGVGTPTTEETIPEGITGVQTRYVITGSATAGTFWFDDASASPSTEIPQGWISGLTGDLGGLGALIQAVIDTFLSAFSKVPVVGGSLEELFRMLGLIPPDNVQGAAGPATMFDSIFAVIDAFLSGGVGLPGSTGGSLADVTNVTSQLASGAALGGYAWQVVNILNNTPVARGMLPTGRANYDITSANTFLSTTQSAALSSSFGLLQAMPIGVVSWYGYGSGGMSAFYINIRKVNLTTGARALVHHSSNIVGNLQAGTTDADADWMFYEIPTPLAGVATDYFYVEFVPVGGTHHIRGMSFSDAIKDHPYSASPCYGTVVDYTSNPNSPASSLAKATAGPNVPWLELAVSVGAVADHREPQIIAFADDGESIPIPSWANRVDAIPLGKGGNGHDGATLGSAGEPGKPGKFAAVTWERDVDFSDGALIQFTVLTDGSAKLSIPGHDTTAAPGADGAGTKLGLKPVGLGPGVLAYNGQSYAGGVDQKVTGGAGGNPGGAGNGGNGIFFQGGGAGGKAAAWVCFRQVEVDGEVTAGDTTPPTAPTSLHIDAVTSSTLTISASGATD